MFIEHKTQCLQHVWNWFVLGLQLFDNICKNNNVLIEFSNIKVICYYNFVFFF